MREKVVKVTFTQLIVFVEKRFELSAMRARGGNEISHPIFLSLQINQFLRIRIMDGFTADKVLCEFCET